MRRTLADPDDGINRDHIEAIKRHRGQIIHKFNFPVARIWIEANEIPAFAREQEVNAVYGVTNLRRYDWLVVVGYKPGFSISRGAMRFAELGGRVKYRFDGINAISGLLPERSAAALRREAGVKYVESIGGVGCLA